MKRLLLTAVLTVACVSAFAQGKVTFGNDANHLITFSTDNAHLTALYSSFNGLAVPQSGAINMGLFTAELLAGTTAGNMTVVSSVNGAAAGFNDGRIPNTTVTLAGIPSGAPAFFEVRLFETLAGTWAATQTGPGRTLWMQASTAVFTVTPGGFLPNPITSSTLSTWANGPVPLGTLDAIPEPSTFALAGLGAAAMLIFRRRK